MPQDNLVRTLLPAPVQLSTYHCLHSRVLTAMIATAAWKNLHIPILVGHFSRFKLRGVTIYLSEP